MSALDPAGGGERQEVRLYYEALLRDSERAFWWKQWQGRSLKLWTLGGRRGLSEQWDKRQVLAGKGL